MLHGTRGGHVSTAQHVAHGSGARSAPRTALALGSSAAAAGLLTGDLPGEPAASPAAAAAGASCCCSTCSRSFFSLRSPAGSRAAGAVVAGRGAGLTGLGASGAGLHQEKNRGRSRALRGRGKGEESNTPVVFCSRHALDVCLGGLVEHGQDPQLRGRGAPGEPGRRPDRGPALLRVEVADGCGSMP